MHIHLDENPVRYVACKSSPSMPYVSLETVAKCSNLDMTATRKWVRVNKVRVHVCRRVVYVAAHAILQFLTEHNKTSDKPPMDVHAGLDILTAKIAPHVPRQPYLPMWRQSVFPVHLLGLAPLLGCISPVAGDVKLQDDGVVHHPVNRRGGGHGVGKDTFPLREHQV